MADPYLEKVYKTGQSYQMNLVFERADGEVWHMPVSSEAGDEQTAETAMLSLIKSRLAESKDLGYLTIQEESKAKQLEGIK